MKFIPRNDFIKLIKIVSADSELISIDVCKELLDSLGDDWFIRDGEFQITRDNSELRKSRIESFDKI